MEDKLPQAIDLLGADLHVTPNEAVGQGDVQVPGVARVRGALDAACDLFTGTHCQGLLQLEYGLLPVGVLCERACAEHDGLVNLYINGCVVMDEW